MAGAKAESVGGRQERAGRSVGRTHLFAIQIEIELRGRGIEHRHEMLPIAIGIARAIDGFGGAGGVAHKEAVVAAVNVQVELLAAAARAFGEDGDITDLSGLHFDPGFQAEARAAGKIEARHRHPAVDSRPHANPRVGIRGRIARLRQTHVEIVPILAAQGIQRLGAVGLVQAPVMGGRIRQHRLGVTRGGLGDNGHRDRRRSHRAKRVGDDNAILARIGHRRAGDGVNIAIGAGNLLAIEKPLISERRAAAGGRRQHHLAAHVTSLGNGRGDDDGRGGGLNAQRGHRAGDRPVHVRNDDVISAGIRDRQRRPRQARSGGIGQGRAVFAPLVRQRAGAGGRHAQRGAIARVERTRRSLRLRHHLGRHFRRAVKLGNLAGIQGFSIDCHFVDEPVEVAFRAVSLGSNGPIHIVDGHRPHGVRLGGHEHAVAIEVPVRAIVRAR